MKTSEKAFVEKNDERREMLRIIEKLQLIEYIMNKYEAMASPGKIVGEFIEIFNSQLTETERDVIRAKYLRKEKTEDICRNMGVSAGVVYAAVTHARRVLLSEENIECMCPECKIESEKVLTRRNREKLIEGHNLSKAGILGLSLSAIEMPEKSRNGLKNANIRTVNQLVDAVTKNPYAWNMSIPTINAKGKKEIESILYGLGVLSRRKTKSNNPIAKISYLDIKGSVSEEMMYFSTAEYQKDMREAIEYGKSFTTEQYEAEAKAVYHDCVKKMCCT